jgi:hypothetical protein
MSHTPGPWEWDGKFMVGIPHKGGDTYFRTNPEDAQLIAAAPDLLDALEMVRDADEDCKRDGLPTIPPVARATIDRALAKAKGEERG